MNTQEQYLDAAAQFKTARLKEGTAARKELVRAQKAVESAEHRLTRALARAHDCMSLSDVALLTGISRSTVQRRLDSEYGKLCQGGG